VISTARPEGEHPMNRYGLTEREEEIVEIHDGPLAPSF
jgi:hypothetical protein